MSTATDDQPQEKAPRTVLVTGAAGFLGSHVVEWLSSSGGFAVTATDVAESDRSDALAALPGVAFAAADLRDIAAVEALVTGSDSVVHLAAVRMKAAASNPRAAYDVNVGATYDLLSLASKHAVRRFVFGSSHTVYGAFQDPHVPILTEDGSAVRPGLGMYAASKLAAEAFVEAFANAGGADYLALRLGTIYGPRANPDSNSGILLDVLNALDRGERPRIPWARDSLHALIFVEDAARAIVSAIDSPQFNVTVNVVGEPVSSEVMYGALVSHYGGDPANIDWLDERTRYQRVSSERMRTVLGIDQSTSLSDGLDSMIDWYRSSPLRQHALSTIAP